MRKILLSSLFLFVALASFAQIKKPYNWTFAAKKLSDTKYEVKFTAKVDNGWHIYSQNTPDGGPVATTFNFTANPLLTATGKVKETGKLESHFEKLFGVDVKQYSDKVEFTQIVVLKAKVKTNFSGSVEFMLCNDKECLPPAKQNFNVELN